MDDETLSEAEISLKEEPLFSECCDKQAKGKVRNIDRTK